MQKTKDKIMELLSLPDVEGMGDLRNYLEASDFFTAPASTKYHLAEEGGLAKHSLNTYELFDEKVKKFKLALPERTIRISALMHDVCKVNHYAYKEYKTKEGGTYSVQNAHPWGHGEKSVIRLMKYIQPTDQEIVLIRWHMGQPSGFYERMDFDAARDRYPALTAMMCADLEASFIVEPRPNRK